MTAIVPPQLKVVFESPTYSGEVLFDKNTKGQKRLDAFLRSLRKQHEQGNARRKKAEHHKLQVQITTV